MPRKARFYIPNMPAHIIQRGNNRQAVFFEDENYQNYKVWLYEAAILHGCEIHAYVLMTNHVHLLVTADSKEGIAKMMQYLGRRYVPYINKMYKRTGTLWEGRYKSSLIEEDIYLLACMRYIEENPVRASMVRESSEYDWSSYAYNAMGMSDVLIKPHPIYKCLVTSRLDAYRSLFDAPIDTLFLEEIRSSVQTGTPLVSERFQYQIEQALMRKIGYRKKGRPRKK